MKKIIYLLIALVLISSCSTNYRNYEYDQYFQTNEPFVTVDSEEEAAQFIARKLARTFRKAPQQNIAILNFTDEYGDRLNRGVFFADMVTSGLLYYRNPRVVEREGLYDIVKEQELSQTSLIANRGSELYQLVQADYIMSGRILRGRYEDMISVRCFRVGTGEVVYASTISIDYAPEPTYVAPVTTGPDVIIVDPYVTPRTDPVIIIDNSGDDNSDDEDGKIDKPVDKPADIYKPKPTTGTEGKGKVDLNNLKKPRTNDDQYQYKKPASTGSHSTVKKPSTYSSNKTSKTNSNTTVKNDIKVVSKPKTVYKSKYVAPVKEEKEDAKEKEGKKSSTSSSSKKSSSSSTSSKKSVSNTSIKKVSTLKK